jgi:hypothetical protein
MQKREAVRLFKEICECIPDLLVNAVSINQRSWNNEGVELKIYLASNQGYLSEVEAIAKSNGMKVTEQAGIISIYEPKQIKVIT